jgi:putative salt-induced outer membrane protein
MPRFFPLRAGTLAACGLWTHAAVAGGALLCGTAGDELVAARAGLNAKWQINDMLNFTQAATYYYDNSNNSLLALSQLTAKLNGRLSARFSFQYNNESNPPPGRLNSDTITRATLVYSF